jgi:hypothetical protein
VQQLLEIAFKEGTAFTLEQILRSEWFSNKVAAEEKLIAHRLSDPSYTTSSLDYWADPSKEPDGLLQHSATPPIDPTFLKQYCQDKVLFKLLGKALISEADAHLPSFAKKVACDWNNLSLDKQIEWAEEIAERLSERTTSPKTPLAARLQGQDQWTGADVLAKPYDYRKCLARYWIRDNTRPACLGMAQVVAAFARRYKTDFHFVTVLTYNDEFIGETTAQFYEKILEDIKSRNLCSKQVISLLKRKIKGGRDVSGLWQYHHAVVLRGSEGKWILIDPYCYTIGILPDDWQFEKTAKTVALYREVLPGFTSIASDGGILAKFRSTWLKKAEKAVRQSKRLQTEWENWVGEGRMYGDHIAFLANHPCSKYLLGIHPFGVNRKLRKYQEGILWIMLGLFEDLHKDKRVRLKERAERYVLNERFRATRKKFLFSRFHWAIGLRYTEDANKIDEKALHPHLEVYADPDHAVALFVLNAISHGLGRQSLSDLVLHHTSSQALWRESTNDQNLREVKTLDGHMKRKMLNRIEQLPFHHSIVLKRLRHLSKVKN